jgi:hypothetical protein
MDIAEEVSVRFSSQQVLSVLTQLVQRQRAAPALEVRAAIYTRAQRVAALSEPAPPTAAVLLLAAQLGDDDAPLLSLLRESTPDAGSLLPTVLVHASLGLAHARAARGDWDGADALCAGAMDAVGRIAAAGPVPPLAMHALLGLSAEAGDMLSAEHAVMRFFQGSTSTALFAEDAIPALRSLIAGSPLQPPRMLAVPEPLAAVLAAAPSPLTLDALEILARAYAARLAELGERLRSAGAVLAVESSASIEDICGSFSDALCIPGAAMEPLLRLHGPARMLPLLALHVLAVAPTADLSVLVLARLWRFCLERLQSLPTIALQAGHRRSSRLLHAYLDALEHAPARASGTGAADDAWQADEAMQALRARRAAGGLLDTQMTAAALRACRSLEQLSEVMRVLDALDAPAAHPDVKVAVVRAVLAVTGSRRLVYEWVLAPPLQHALPEPPHAQTLSLSDHSHAQAVRLAVAPQPHPTGAPLEPTGSEAPPPQPTLPRAAAPRAMDPASLMASLLPSATGFTRRVHANSEIAPETLLTVFAAARSADALQDADLQIMRFALNALVELRAAALPDVELSAHESYRRLTTGARGGVDEDLHAAMLRGSPMNVVQFATMMEEVGLLLDPGLERPPGAELSVQQRRRPSLVPAQLLQTLLNHTLFCLHLLGFAPPFVFSQVALTRLRMRKPTPLERGFLGSVLPPAAREYVLAYPGGAPGDPEAHAHAVSALETALESFPHRAALPPSAIMIEHFSPSVVDDPYVVASSQAASQLGPYATMHAGSAAVRNLMRPPVLPIDAAKPSGQHRRGALAAQLAAMHMQLRDELDKGNRFAPHGALMALRGLADEIRATVPFERASIPRQIPPMVPYADSAAEEHE